MKPKNSFENLVAVIIVLIGIEVVVNFVMSSEAKSNSTIESSESQTDNT